VQITYAGLSTATGSWLVKFLTLQQPRCRSGRLTPAERTGLALVPRAASDSHWAGFPRRHRRGTALGLAAAWGKRRLTRRKVPGRGR
jgi:hypothetical protein